MLHVPHLISELQTLQLLKVLLKCFYAVINEDTKERTEINRTD